MAFAPVEKKTIEVICEKDEAVDCTPGEYQEYLKTLDEEILELKEGLEPTRFLLKTVLDYKSTQRLKNMQLSYSQSDGEMGVKLGFSIEEVRIALVGIKNPGAKSIEFKKDGDGFASKGLIEILEASGIISDLYNARQLALNVENDVSPKKKSRQSLSSPSVTPAS